MSSPVLVVLRCFNDAWVVGDTLEAVLAQTDARPRVVAIDSGSSDGSVAILRRFPVELIEIPLGSYIPGRVLNLGMAQGDEPFAVFVNSDCTPLDDHWLAELVAPLDADSGVAAVYSRQIARPDAHPLVAKDYERAFGDGRVAASWRHFFSMASSAVRRSVWQQHPFDPDIRYSEDIHWTWRRRQEGWRIAYAPRSVSMHSHNYTLAEMRRRYAGEGEADARIYPTSSHAPGFARAVLRTALSEVARDLLWCSRHGHLGAALVSPVHRWVQRTSYWRGLRHGLETADVG